MAVRGAELQDALIEQVRARVRERLPEPEAELCQEFVRHFYRLVPAEDLSHRDVQDLYGAAVAAWRMLAGRQPGEPVVRVHNPDLEQDGWQSRHTVLAIVSDDMPFIVDSVTMELSRAGYPLHLIIHPVIRVRRDHEHRVVAVVERDADAPDARGESVMHVELEREPDRARHRELHERIEAVLEQVRLAVSDWQSMRARALECSDELAARCRRRRSRRRAQRGARGGDRVPALARPAPLHVPRLSATTSCAPARSPAPPSCASGGLGTRESSAGSRAGRERR